MIEFISEAKWEIREPGRIHLVGADHISIKLDLSSALPYHLEYRGEMIGKLLNLADAKVAAMVMPAMLLDFGMEP